MTATPNILIVTGEASGDLHGANLVKAMRRMRPELSFAGMGGVAMAAAGVELLCNARQVSVMGLTEVISRLPAIWAAQRLLRRALVERRPALLIIIDLPDFNLLLAKKAKQLGIPVFYYISPQVWAWRSGRVKTIGERVDRVGVILPFEEQFFRERGVAADYVGHPLLDEITVDADPTQFRRQQAIPAERTCIGLLPGSRLKEIQSLLPIFLAAAEQLQSATSQRLTFLIPLASTIDESELWVHGLDRYRALLDLRVVTANRYDMMACCRAVVAASGTVTLELALLDVPMVVTYRVSPLTNFIGRMLVKVDYFCLVNLIAGREVVPELFQDQVTVARIAKELEVLVDTSEERRTMLAGLAEVRQKLGGKGASAKAAGLALDILGGGAGQKSEDSNQADRV